MSWRTKAQYCPGSSGRSKASALHCKVGGQDLTGWEQQGSSGRQDLPTMNRVQADPSVCAPAHIFRRGLPVYFKRKGRNSGVVERTGTAQRPEAAYRAVLADKRVVVRSQWPHARPMV